MDVDPLSPVAPAWVRVLVVPVGRIKRSRFTSCLNRLRKETVVRLGDVSPDGGPNRNMFSPLAFPNGSVLYYLTTSATPDAHASLAPFELFRESLLVLGLADAEESQRSSEATASNGTRETNEELDGQIYSGLSEAYDSLLAQFPRALVHRVLLFDYVPDSSTKPLPANVITVPPLEQSKITTIKTLMCDLTSFLLAEMTTFAKALQALPTIESPRLPRTARRPISSSSSNTYGAARGFGSRPSSPPGQTADRAQARLSMPAHLPSSTGLGTNSWSHQTSRPSTPRTQTPPVQDSREPPGGQASPKQGISSAKNSSIVENPGQAAGRDRVSVHGFGPGSLSERARNKGKGRTALVVGTLYLHAGRWPDAIRELVESARIAWASSDHVWHAKALENILIGLLLLLWAGIDFQTPDVCYPTADKSNAATDSVSFGNSSSAAEGKKRNSSGASGQSVSFESITALIPDLVNMILNFYVRATDFPGEGLPEVAFSESVIRSCKLLSIIHLCGGVLSKDGVRTLVSSGSEIHAPNLSIPKPFSHPTRTEIATMLFRAFPAPSSMSEISVADKVGVLAAMASVLSTLGLHRKKGLVLREMIATLVPGLIRARTLNAAEMGVHPAAGLAVLASAGRPESSQLDGEGLQKSQGGMGDLLGVIGQIYGVVTLEPSYRRNQSSIPQSVSEDTETSRSQHERDEVIIARILRDAKLRSFGSRANKLDILKHCINLCEALPDFQGALRFTSELLRTTGSGIAPRPDSDEGSTALSREEQMRLATNIPRTINAANKLGIDGLEAEYWDEFLVRGLEVLDLPSLRSPLRHAKRELDMVQKMEEQKEKSPFIYNPFSQRPKGTTVDKYLVAGESAEFRITLQNPFDFDVEIESITLETTGVEFDSIPQSTVIGGYRTKLLPLTGTPRTGGSMTVTGCMVGVRGCRRRRFPIFPDPWSPEKDTKMKSIGIAAVMTEAEATPTAIDTSPKKRPAPSLGPIPSRLQLTVIDPQPLISIESTSLSQSALMLLEGETSNFSVTLKNSSSTTPMDLLLVSFQDSTTTFLRAARNSKDISAANMYELDMSLSRKEAFRWRQAKDSKTFLGPGESMTLEIDALGKPGLSEGAIQIDYAYLGKTRSEISDVFYTRQVSAPVNVTVFGSVGLVRTEILPISSDVSWFMSKETRDHPENPASLPAAAKKSSLHPLFQKLSSNDEQQDYSLLVLDFQNSWSSPLNLSIQLDERFRDDEKRDRPDRPATPSQAPPLSTSPYHLNVTIPPNQASRHVLPIRRIFLPNPYAPIPTYDSSTQRQYVVNSGHQSPETERSEREVFWYREEILKMIRAEWRECDTETSDADEKVRGGEVDLRTMRINPREVDAIKVEDLDVKMTVVSTPSDVTDDDSPPSADLKNGDSGSEPDIVQQLSKSRFLIRTHEFLHLRCLIHNRSAYPIRPLLRLQPRLRQPSHISSTISTSSRDLTKRLVWTGVLQRPLAEIGAGDTDEAELSFCVLAEGDYEFGAVVEELTAQKREVEKGTEISPREKAIQDLGRRTWIMREACGVFARDSRSD